MSTRGGQAALCLRYTFFTRRRIRLRSTARRSAFLGVIMPIRVHVASSHSALLATCSRMCCARRAQRGERAQAATAHRQREGATLRRDAQERRVAAQPLPLAKPLATYVAAQSIRRETGQRAAPGPHLSWPGRGTAAAAAAAAVPACSAGGAGLLLRAGGANGARAGRGPGLARPLGSASSPLPLTAHSARCRRKCSHGAARSQRGASSVVSTRRAQARPSRELSIGAQPLSVPACGRATGRCGRERASGKVPSTVDYQT